MGPKFTRLQKMKPEMMPIVFQDVRLLQMMGAKQTQLGKGYTQRYDHGLIPLTALQELALKVKREDLEIKSTPMDTTPMDTTPMDTIPMDTNLDQPLIEEEES